MIKRFCPAKINLSLHVGPPREDGFHELASVVALLDWGDELILKPALGKKAIEFTVNDGGSGLPADERNLVYRAALLFRQKFPDCPPVRFDLKKNLPAGAGLGGGSSNAVQTILGLEEFTGHSLSSQERLDLLATLGSDCPLFTKGRAVAFLGRGEVLQSLPEALYQKIKNRLLLLLKPAFPVSTVWAFGAWRQRVAGQTGTLEVSSEVWREEQRTRIMELDRVEDLGNDLYPLVAGKYPALPVLAKELQEEFRLTLQMTGSGSACFAFLPESFPPERLAKVQEKVRRCWGPDALFSTVRIF